MKFATAALLLNAVSALKIDLLNGKNAPSTGQEWVSVGKKQEAQIADFSKHSPEKATRMRATFNRMLGGQEETSASITFDLNFYDSTQYYPDEQQAWRYLGLFVDCNPEVELGGDNDEDGDRDLSGSDDGSDTTCRRYVLWAAYIDPNYEGNGIGEYAFWDRHTQSWDKSACEATGSSCRKMDCHLPDTEFELLGFFKMKSTKDFMDQLFKHEGYCTWSQEEYNFMQGHAKTWPRGCTPLYIDDLYVDIKPMFGGDWSLGIYTNEICTQEYTGGVMEILEQYAEANPYYPSHDSGNYEYGDMFSIAENIDTWNSAMAFWKQCNPCRCYNIGNGQQHEDSQDEEDGRKLDEDNGGGDDAFYCNDDAGYYNVNQCMKFFAKTNLQPATFRNVAMANDQASIVQVELANGKTVGTDFTVSAYYSLKSGTANYALLVGLFVIALAVFILGTASFIFVWRTKDRRISSSTLKHPLVESKGEIA